MIDDIAYLGFEVIEVCYLQMKNEYTSGQSSTLLLDVTRRHPSVSPWIRFPSKDPMEPVTVGRSYFPSLLPLNMSSKNKWSSCSLCTLGYL